MQHGRRPSTPYNVRERFEALERQTEPLQQQTRTGASWWWCLPWRVAALVVLGLALAHPAWVQAETFRCRGGDVQCLIDAINAANANGQTNTIRLEMGTYALPASDNGTPGDANGLPVITSRLTITGKDAETTSIVAAGFRVLKVEATGDLTLQGLTLRRGGTSFRGGGIFNSGSLTLRHCMLTENVAFNTGGGIYNQGTLTLHASLLRDNVSIQASGGGFYRRSEKDS